TDVDYFNGLDGPGRTDGGGEVAMFHFGGCERHSVVIAAAPGPTENQGSHSEECGRDRGSIEQALGDLRHTCCDEAPFYTSRGAWANDKLVIVEQGASATATICQGHEVL